MESDSVVRENRELFEDHACMFDLAQNSGGRTGNSFLLCQTRYPTVGLLVRDLFNSTTLNISAVFCQFS